MKQAEILNKVITVLDENCKQDGWTDLALIGAPLMQAGVHYKALGYLKLKDFLEQFPENIEFRVDTSSYKVPVVYARNKATRSLSRFRKPESRSRGVRVTNKLLSWAWMGDFPKVVGDLADFALKERWYYKTMDPAFPNPILIKYLNYTFFRLSKESGKILATDKYAAFNTGLVNKLYEPIYALFEKNRRQAVQNWYFMGFCNPGVDRLGKILSSNFNPLPQRAHFFADPSELIYNIEAPEPQLDWNHIILDNVSRLPIEFLEENKPSGFELRNTTLMDTVERADYFERLSRTIERDSKTFRAIKSRFSESLTIALKRVQWNFKTAIPMYYPASNKLSLLLPLSLMDDDVIDLALVTEKTPSGSYLGHTILPLDWAYSNARLITRPDSDWLVAERIDTSSIVEGEESV